MSHVCRSAGALSRALEATAMGEQAEALWLALVIERAPELAAAWTADDWQLTVKILEQLARDWLAALALRLPPRAEFAMPSVFGAH